jgi:hypothetical protein
MSLAGGTKIRTESVLGDNEEAISGEIHRLLLLERVCPDSSGGASATARTRARDHSAHSADDRSG